jgi:hypothetical protein
MSHLLKFLRKFFVRREKYTYITTKEFCHTHFSGRVCNICKEPYVGVAQDCKCTNYGD